MTVKGHSSRRWEKSPGVYENKCQASTVTVKGHSSRRWEKSPGVYENKCQASTVTVKGHSCRRWEKVLEFMKINARHQL